MVQTVFVMRLMKRGLIANPGKLEFVPALAGMPGLGGRVPDRLELRSGGGGQLLQRPGGKADQGKT